MPRDSSQGPSTATVVPPGIAALGPDVTRQVDRLVRDAARRQDEQVADAVATALHTVPRPLRGIVRRALGA